MAASKGTSGNKSAKGRSDDAVDDQFDDDTELDDDFEDDDLEDDDLDDEDELEDDELEDDDEADLDDEDGDDEDSDVSAVKLSKDVGKKRTADKSINKTKDAAKTGKAAGKAGKAKSAKSSKSVKATKTSTVGGPKPVRFVRESVGELRKVLWPSRTELITYSFVVIVFVVIMVAIVAGLDVGFAKLVLLAFG